MAEQDETETSTDEDPEVEAFAGINTTRSNIKHQAAASGGTAVGGVGAIGGIGVGQSGYGIKENGIK